MSTEATTKMLAMYKQTPRPTAFFSSQFMSTPENFHNSEAVEIDIQRGDEEVAIAVQSLVSGYNWNSNDLYTNKRFIPPVFKEAFALSAFDMIKRVPGQNPFEDVAFQASAMQQFLAGMLKVQDKILRTVELQAAQALQLGVVTLINAAGTAVYTIDYKPKATHRPTCAPHWDDANATIAGDIESLMDVIRNDGKMDPVISIWGIKALKTALADVAFKALFETRRADIGSIIPMEDRGNGAKYRGTVDIGHYPLEIWTYEGRYKHPQTGVITQYMNPVEVLIMCRGADLRMTWGNVPMILPPEQRVLPFVPPRISRPGAGGMDLITNTWTTADGEQLFGGVSARPLAIPVAIDTFGCLVTGIA